MKASEKKNGSPPTIIDVADKAGVSMKTVSRVVNNEAKVSEGTRKRVQDAIEVLGYQRNVFARGLRADRSLVLGLLYENPQGDYPADVLHGALAHCRESGYHLVVEVLKGVDMGAQTIRFLSQTRLDGMIMTPPVCDNISVIEALNKFDLPYVRISPNNPRAGEAYITVDDFAASKEMVEYLLSLGHRRIGLVKGIVGHAATEGRLSGYRSALLDAGIDFDESLIVDGNFDFATGVAGGQKLLQRSNPPTAVFASNDETAAGLLSYAHSIGMRVPENLSVCGFDGGVISKVVWPRLTTIKQPIKLLGESAVRQLISSGDDEPQLNVPIILPHELIVGESTTSYP